MARSARSSTTRLLYIFCTAQKKSPFYSPIPPLPPRLLFSPTSLSPGSIQARRFSAAVQRTIGKLPNFEITSHMDSRKLAMAQRIQYYTGRIHEIGAKDGLLAKMDSGFLEGRKGIINDHQMNMVFRRRVDAEMAQTSGLPILPTSYEGGSQSAHQLTKNVGVTTVPCFSRSFSSKASDSSKQNRSEQSRKEVSTVEDPFDAPTYNIPERPVTFVEGASYSVVILIGIGIAAAAAYAVFKELIFEPKEYKIFNKALERIQSDSQVRVRIGSPITGYGQESRNRAARQRIPNRTWTDEDGVEHVEVNFYVRGPHGAGKVFTEMFKDKDKQWKFTYLIVDIKSPSPAQLMLESYVPA